MNQGQMEANILLCGSARVGKSSLINAICQQQLAKSNASLDSCTQHLTKYQMEYTENDHLHRTIFWDLPGIESWNESDVRHHMKKLIGTTKPLCMIYCASPGSFAKLEHVEWLVSECADQQVFCALVCTNMWAGRTRQVILKEFRNILQKVHQNVQPFETDKVICFGGFGLCTMVNSETYIDDDIGIRKDPSGVNELILGIAKSLDREHRSTWLRVVAQNQSFWSQMTFELNDLLSAPVEEEKTKNNTRADGQGCSTNSFFQPMGFEQNFGSSTWDSDTWECEASSISPDSEDQQSAVDNTSPDNSSTAAIGNDRTSSNSDPSSAEMTLTEKPSSMESRNIETDSGSRSDSIYTIHEPYTYDECAFISEYLS